MVAGYVIIMAALALGLRLSRRGPGGAQAVPVEAADVGHPVEAAEAGHPVEAADAGHPVEAADAGHPVEAADAGHPVEAADAGQLAAGKDAGPPAVTMVSAAGWWRLARQVAGTMIGGYLLLVAVVILYYYLVARVAGAFIKSAFTGCALLIGLVVPVFAAASWLAERRRQHRAAHAHSPRPEPR